MGKYLFSAFFLVFCCATMLAQHSGWHEYIEKKQFEKVISEAGNLQPADSADFSKMYLIGQAYEGLLRYKDAYHCYKQCYLLDSTRTDMLNTLARISVNIGKLKEAETYYQLVLEYDSTNFYANHQLARLYVALERYADGLKYYDLLLEKDPENAVILRAKGDCYTRVDSLYSALDCYSMAYKANIENASLASLLINTLLNLYNPLFNNFANEAFAVCDTALFYNPGHKTLRQKKAMIYYLKSEYVQADSLYSSLMAEQDSSYVTLKYCGCSRYYARKWFDAVEPLEKAFEKDSTAIDVCLLLGISVGRTYDPKKALSYFDKAEKLMEPDEYWNDQLVQFRAEMLAKTGSCDKSAELYYRLWKKEKKQLAWLQNIQICYNRKDMEGMTDEERHRALFINYLYASEVLERPKMPSGVEQYLYLRSVLKKYEEEMFFRGVKSLPMISPDNKKSALSLEKLKELTDKLSED
ncbi:MAG: hypothetical protein LBV74_14990 [Tannerella sp.]|jgi:tetratricopeptide (TPR) repeat protein|nr:hypothetical protein [Tannerella sp.]